MLFFFKPTLFKIFTIFIDEIDCEKKELVVYTTHSSLS